MGDRTSTWSTVETFTQHRTQSITANGLLAIWSRDTTALSKTLLTKRDRSYCSCGRQRRKVKIPSL